MFLFFALLASNTVLLPLVPLTTVHSTSIFDTVLSLCLCFFFHPQIVNMVKDKLILPSSYGAVKIAGLYLLSDILHNAGAPVKHASAYRYVYSSAVGFCNLLFFDRISRRTLRFSFLTKLAHGVHFRSFSYLILCDHSSV